MFAFLSLCTCHFKLQKSSIQLIGIEILLLCTTRSQKRTYINLGRCAQIHYLTTYAIQKWCMPVYCYNYRISFSFGFEKNDICPSFYSKFSFLKLLEDYASKISKNAWDQILKCSNAKFLIKLCKLQKLKTQIQRTIIRENSQKILVCHHFIAQYVLY